MEIIFRIFYKIFLFFLVVSLFANPPFLYLALALFAFILLWAMWYGKRKIVTQPQEPFKQPEVKYVIIQDEENWKKHYQPKS